MPSGWQRCTSVKNTDVVETKETTFKYVLAVTIFAIRPPSEVQHELVKGTLQERKIDLLAQGLRGAM